MAVNHSPEVVQKAAALQARLNGNSGDPRGPDLNETLRQARNNWPGSDGGSPQAPDLRPQPTRSEPPPPTATPEVQPPPARVDSPERDAGGTEPSPAVREVLEEPAEASARIVLAHDSGSSGGLPDQGVQAVPAEEEPQVLTPAAAGSGQPPPSEPPNPPTDQESDAGGEEVDSGRNSGVPEERTVIPRPLTLGAGNGGGESSEKPSDVTGGGENEDQGSTEEEQRRQARETVDRLLSGQLLPEERILRDRVSLIDRPRYRAQQTAEERVIEQLKLAGATPEEVARIATRFTPGVREVVMGAFSEEQPVERSRKEVAAPEPALDLTLPVTVNGSREDLEALAERLAASLRVGGAETTSVTFNGLPRDLAELEKLLAAQNVTKQGKPVIVPGGGVTVSLSAPPVTTEKSDAGASIQTSGTTPETSGVQAADNTAVEPAGGGEASVPAPENTPGAAASQVASEGEESEFSESVQQSAEELRIQKQNQALINLLGNPSQPFNTAEQTVEALISAIPEDLPQNVRASRISQASDLARRANLFIKTASRLDGQVLYLLDSDTRGAILGGLPEGERTQAEQRLQAYIGGLAASQPPGEVTGNTETPSPAGTTAPETTAAATEPNAAESAPSQDQQEPDGGSQSGSWTRYLRPSYWRGGRGGQRTQTQSTTSGTQEPAEESPAEAAPAPPVAAEPVVPVTTPPTETPPVEPGSPPEAPPPSPAAEPTVPLVTAESGEAFINSTAEYIRNLLPAVESGALDERQAQDLINGLQALRTAGRRDMEVTLADALADLPEERRDNMGTLFLEAIINNIEAIDERVGSGTINDADRDSVDALLRIGGRLRLGIMIEDVSEVKDYIDSIEKKYLSGLV